MAYKKYFETKRNVPYNKFTRKHEINTRKVSKNYHYGYTAKRDNTLPFFNDRVFERKASY